MKINEYISLSDWDKLSSEEQEGVLNYLILFHSIGRPIGIRHKLHNHFYGHPALENLRYGSIIMYGATIISLTELKRMAQIGSFA